MKDKDKFSKTSFDILKAVYNLLSVKDESKISVSEICRILRMNRSTFYAHYKDLDEVISLVDIPMVNSIRDLAINHKEFTPEVLESIFSFIKRNDAFFLAYIREDNTSDFIPFFRSFFSDLSPLEREYVSRYWSSGMNAILEFWLKTDTSRSEEELADIFIHEVLDNIKEGVVQYGKEIHGNIP